MLTKWTVTGSHYAYRDRFLSHRVDRCVTDDGVVVDPYHVIELKDWINVVAVTPDLEILLIREFRHAAGEIVTGLPSGTFDPGDDAPSCAKRELREETGGVANAWYATGRAFSNPATMTNRTHFFLATGVELTGETNFDPNERIETNPMPATDVYRGLSDGGLVVQALHLASLYSAAAFVRVSRDPALTALGHAIERAYRRD